MSADSLLPGFGVNEDRAERRRAELGHRRELHDRQAVLVQHRPRFLDQVVERHELRLEVRVRAVFRDRRHLLLRLDERTRQPVHRRRRHASSLTRCSDGSRPVLPRAR
jgi:hypothetical protein